VSILKQTTLAIATTGRGTKEISEKVQRVVEESNVTTGLCHLFIRHTSASLIITENADPDVHLDLETFLSELVPDGDARYIHTAEGPDDMAAHVRSVLTATELTVPVTEGCLALGTWQGIYLWEHRQRPHQREIMVTVQGSPSRVL